MNLPPGVAGATLAVGRTDLSGGASLSGHERNHLFLNDGDGGLADVSGLSGLDDPADGRALGWLDYDRDGWLDFAVVNANAPTLQLYRNQMSDLPAAAERGAISVRLVGGNRFAVPSSDWSNRDGVGARLEVEIGARVLVRELRAGEGFAAQNSATLYVGIGEAPSADIVRVRWPSGRTQSASAVPAGNRITFYENAKYSPDGSGLAMEPIARQKAPAALTARPRHERDRLHLSEAFGESNAPLRVFTTTATWCESCLGELPDVARLREKFPPSALDLIAVPIDETDTSEKLLAYTQRYDPQYTMIYDRSASDVKEIQNVIQKTLRRDVLPASIVTDQENQARGVYWGLPTVSDIRAIQEKVKGP